LDGPDIDWVGPVFDADRLARHYERATVFAYPSLAEKGEAFGVAPLEAMASGAVPVFPHSSAPRFHHKPGYTVSALITEPRMHTDFLRCPLPGGESRFTTNRLTFFAREG